MALPVLDRGPVAAPDHERGALMALDRLLESAHYGLPKLIGPGGEEIELPETVSCVLHQVVRAMARDQAVTVVPIGKQLTTQQAADVLNVSRPYLIQLLDAGEIPYTKTGTHRRIWFDDLIEYKLRRDAKGKADLDRLSQMGQATGQYFKG